MFNHVSLGTNDLPRAMAFYDAALAPLDVSQVYAVTVPDSGLVAVAYGPSQDQPQFWVQHAADGKPATVGNGVHVAFSAKSRAAVDAFHAAAMGAGGTDAGAAGLRPEYHEHYYGAFVRDPDGNKIEACCHAPE